jgi:hypothetical protein
MEAKKKIGETDKNEKRPAGKVWNQYGKPVGSFGMAVERYESTNVSIHEE